MRSIYSTSIATNSQTLSIFSLSRAASYLSPLRSSPSLPPQELDSRIWGWEAASLQITAIFLKAEQLFAVCHSIDAARSSLDFYICSKASFYAVEYLQAV